MPQSGSLLTLAAALSTANAAFQGFNYGAAFTSGAVKQQSDFEQEFEHAQGLDGTDGAFNSARLYTMIQGGTPNDPISAIPAAIQTKTSLLFGLWASAGDEAFNGEIEALQKTIDQYCDQLDGLVAGISVGSEDLYRNSPTGIENGEYAGANPDTLVGYIERVRETIKGSCLSDAPIGHVDTWTAYDNSSNSAVIEACDWLGMDAYAYFENTKPNSIENGAGLFQDALDRTTAAAQGKDIWITETGWPVSGKDFGDAVASPENARTFWEEVGCPRFGNVNVWWYTLKDAAPDTPNPSFGVIGSEWTTEPIYDLTCDGSSPDPDTSSSSSSSAAEPTSETTSEPTSEPTKEPTHAPEPTKESSSDEPAPEPTVSETNDVEPIPLPEPTSVSIPPQSPSSSWSTTIGHNSTVVVIPGPSSTVTEVIPPEETTEPAPTTGGGDGQPTDTITTVTSPGGGDAPTEIPEAGSTRLNSLGAAFVAVVLAIGFF